MKNEKREYLERVLKDWRVFCKAHRLFEEAITEALKNLKEYEKMQKYIIVKRNAKTNTTEYLKGDNNETFEWTKDITEANKYCDYDMALSDWHYVNQWYNPERYRIFIPIYNDNYEEI